MTARDADDVLNGEEREEQQGRALRRGERQRREIAFTCGREPERPDGDSAELETRSRLSPELRAPRFQFIIRAITPRVHWYITRRSVTRTPLKPSRRAARQDMKRELKYAVEENALRPTAETEYLNAARLLINTTVWTDIVEDAKVVEAHTAWKATVARGTDYNAVTRLLNSISLAYITYAVRSTDKSTPAVVYTTPNTKFPDGDYLGVAAKADFFAQMVLLRVLEAALELPEPSLPRVPERWARNLGIGEGKPNPISRRGQFLWYLSSLKRYRVDLDTVHGFQVQGNELFLSSLNACGAWLSETAKDGAVDRWVAHIVLLYHSHNTRDASLSLLAPADGVEYDRWSLSLVQEHAAGSDEHKSVTLAPYSNSQAPGRMTWLGFQLDDDPSISAFISLYQTHPTGFLKISWQDTCSVFKECELLKVAHGITRPTADGSIIDAAPEQAFVPSDVQWLPGLTRFWPQSSRRDGPENAIGHDFLGKGVRRVKEIIHLASLGQPLSQCESSSHLLNVIFDAIGTHSRLLRRGVLHRDVSWFNLLCNPWHHKDTGDWLEDGYPSAKYVLNGEKSPPCSLLVDLDHSGLMEILHSPDYQHRKERTGTPMFSAIELSTKSVASYEINPMRLNGIIKKLRSIEDDKDMFGRAFPDYDGRFIADLQTVLERELERDGLTTTSPAVLHMPRHDVESLYWVLLWGLARACPQGCDADGADLPLPHSQAYNTFVNSMLGHTANDVSARTSYLFELGGKCAQLLHPQLVNMAELVQDIARYLSVPWHLYDDLMQVDHAHIAVQRLILLHQRDKTNLNVIFDTSSPRTAYTVESASFSRSTQPTGTGLFSASDAVCVLYFEKLAEDASLPRGSKRKPEDSAPMPNVAKFQWTKRERALAEAFPHVERDLTAAGFIDMIVRDRLWFGSCVHITKAPANAGADAN